MARGLGDAIVRALQAGEPARAAGLCEQSLAGAPDDPAVLALRAVAWAQSGRLQDARLELERLERRLPADPDVPLNLGNVCLDQGDATGAIGAFTRACALTPQRADALLGLGSAHFRAGDFAAAVQALESALFADPGSGLSAILLARARLELDDSVGALAALQSVTSPAGLDAAALNDLGLAWIALDELARARAAFGNALQFDPAFDEALLNLATLAERDNQLAAAADLLTRLSHSFRETPLARLASARLAARRGDPAAALQELAGIDCASLPPRQASEISFERGQLLDRLGDADAAFAEFQRGNDLARAQQGTRRRSAAVSPDWLSDHPELDAAVLAAQAIPLPSAPVFLVGFPRSGTTLLDQMLDAHPAFAVLEEKPAVEEMVRLLRQRPRGYAATLAELMQADVDRLRAAYHAVVARHLRPAPGQVLVDKYPFNLARLQLILRVFPGARFIFAVRHPCDVVLSCFMQNFRFTDSTQGFWSLDGTVDLYVRTMRLWLDQQARLQPRCHEVRYESLVENPEREARALVRFLGVPWDDAVLRYADHARRRQIRTPSYGQVVQPVYRHAVNRWHRYRNHMKAQLEALAPLAQRLGYHIRAD